MKLSRSVHLAYGKVLFFLWLHNILLNIKKLSHSDIRVMVAWEVSLASLLEVSTIWIAITQQHIPCLMHKHIWETCALKHVKVGRWAWTREVGREKSWDSAQHAARSSQPKLTVALSLERGRIGLPLILPSARMSRDMVSIPAGVVCTHCGLTQGPGPGWSTEVQLGSLAITIPDRETMPRSPSTSPHSPRADSRPQKKLY